ncbi:MAG TPA: prenyltransferase/squalene oxidase repeat-containing protein, partial [Thermomicrobiales bacterium]|nr:prenyltransferase/squalene oxidase repeat-containing protein [Thermomicrobiales bacterium]
TMQPGSSAAQVASPDATPALTGLDGAVAWLVAQQGEDGSFPGFAGEPDANVTIDAILSLTAASHAGIDTSDASERAIGYLGSGDVALVYAQTGAGQAAKLVLALSAAGQNGTDFAGIQPVTLIEAGLSLDTGIYGTGVYDHSLAILALSAIGSDVPQAAIDALAATQAENGGWAFDGTTEAANVDSNTTAMVIQALVATGQGDSDLVIDSLGYLDACSSDAGVAWNDVEGSVADANSTGIAIQAFVAAGQDAGSLTTALAAFQNPSGAFFYNDADTSDNLFATLQAIPAMAGVAFPVAPVAESADALLAA